jgi:hypothetical protein
MEGCGLTRNLVESPLEELLAILCLVRGISVTFLALQYQIAKRPELYNAINRQYRLVTFHFGTS